MSSRLKLAIIFVGLCGFILTGFFLWGEHWETWLSPERTRDFFQEYGNATQLGTIPPALVYAWIGARAVEHPGPAIWSLVLNLVLFSVLLLMVDTGDRRQTDLQITRVIDHVEHDPVEELPEEEITEEADHPDDLEFMDPVHMGLDVSSDLDFSADTAVNQVSTVETNVEQLSALMTDIVSPVVAPSLMVGRTASGRGEALRAHGGSP